MSLPNVRNVFSIYSFPKLSGNILSFLRGHPDVLQDIPFFRLFEISALLKNSFHCYATSVSFLVFNPAYLVDLVCFVESVMMVKIVNIVRIV